MSEIIPEEEKKIISNSIKGMKFFAELVLSLPDDFEFEEKKLDALLEPKTIELMQKLSDNGMSLIDLVSSIDLTQAICNLTLGRCKNQTKNLLMQVYFNTFGVYNPQEEMPFAKIQELLIKHK
jgi:hypothetical protein